MDPGIFTADVGFPFVVVPVRFQGEGFMEALVKELVMGEYDMAADVKELWGIQTLVIAASR